MNELYQKTAAELSPLLQAGAVSAVDVVQAYLERIETVEPHLQAFISHTPALALSTARETDEKRKRGEQLHPLAGIPVVVKDNISTKDLRTTCASRMLQQYIPPYDATVVVKLKDACMPLLGKTNMDEFAMGSSTENSAFYPTRNPWDRNRVPGGSSGGSAVAVAAGMSPIALGSDTGGSIRQPAAFCGLTGLRPTYGRVSRYGLIAFASSLDQVGILSATARDCALLLSLISGWDPLDSTALSGSVPDYVALLEALPPKPRIGIIRNRQDQAFDREMLSVLEETAVLLQSLGADLDEVTLPHTDYGLSAYYLIAPSEASSNLGRYDGVRYGYNAGGEDVEKLFSRTRGTGFGAEVKRRIMIGTYALSAGYFDAYYLQAQKVRTLIRRDYEAAFEKFDLLMGPATPAPAFRLGEKTDDPLQMYLSDICNITDSLAGVPSLVVPGGINSSGLPLGIQLTAPPLREDRLLQVAHLLENSRGVLPLEPRYRSFGSGEERSGTDAV